MSKRRIPGDVRAQVLRDYMAGDFVYKIAQRYGISPGHVTKIAKAAGARLHGQGCRKEGVY